MAYFHKGFTYEFDVHQSTPLAIEGRPIENGAATTEFARHYIDSRLAGPRDAVKAQHLEVLRRADRDEWNDWRTSHPGVQPTLANEDLRIGKSFDGFDFSYANFCESNLGGVSLRGANFHQAILARTNFTQAILEGANFCRADLYETDFTAAHLEKANLQGTQLVRAMMEGAFLDGCLIYGLSAWDLQGKANETGLRVRYRHGLDGNEPEVEVRTDSLDLATFMHFTSDRANIGRVIEATARKWVLLLGRFEGDGRRVLDVLDRELRRQEFMPIVFDFPPPERRDLVETLILLAGLSAFVVVDISEPRSTPLELMAIAPAYAVPILPILRTPGEPFAMFAGLARYPWVRTVLAFDDLERMKDEVLAQILEYTRNGSAGRGVTPTR